MAIGVDTSKWKPRKIRGTPAHVVRNRIAYGIISVGVICGLIFHFSPITYNLRKAVEVLYEESEQEIERKQMVTTFLRQRTGDQFRQQMEDEKSLALPHK